MARHYEIIIAGAGPAGASLAARLAKAGRQVLLVDQGTFPRPKVCGECLAVGAWHQLAELDLDNQVTRLAERPAQLRIVAPGGQSVAVTLRPGGPEPIITISRYQLDRMLLERARESGAELLAEHRVRRVLSNADGVCGIEVSPSTATGAPMRLGCRMLIAAEGRHSQVVRQTGDVHHDGLRLVGFKTHLAASEMRSPADAVEMHSFAGGYLGICPIENNMANVCGLLPRTVLRVSRGSVPQALATLMPRGDGALLQTLAEATSWQTIAHVGQQTATPSKPGVLYLGDAQGTIEPLAGQGISMALESAAMAAAALSGSVAIDRRLQQAYLANWHRRYRSSIRHAARFGWLLRHPRVLNALISLSPLPRTWQSAIAHEGYVATRLKPG